MTDETPIRQGIAEWAQAFCDKDADRLVALYEPGAICFDAIPPLSETVEGMREKLVGCLPYFPDGFAIETRDLTLAVGQELAGAHYLWRFIDLPPGHPAGRHWLRSSVVWRKQADGRWLIAHDHCSAPFDPYTERAVLTLDEAPDASAAADGCAARNPAGWFEIYVQDMARAKAFYTAVFGVELTRLEGPIELWAFPMRADAYGASGALAQMPGREPGGNSVIVYFSCADCAVEAGRAAESGGQVVRPKFSIGQYGHIALVEDTEGNLIGLHSMP